MLLTRLSLGSVGLDRDKLCVAVRVETGTCCLCPRQSLGGLVGALSQSGRDKCHASHESGNDSSVHVPGAGSPGQVAIFLQCSTGLGVGHCDNENRARPTLPLGRTCRWKICGQALRGFAAQEPRRIQLQHFHGTIQLKSAFD